MKFYFCEKCGDRLTEADIDSGHAKNKKLKGVFCSSCSNGILTMEMLPIGDAEARKLVGHEGGNNRPKATKHPTYNPQSQNLEKLRYLQVSGRSSNTFMVTIMGFLGAMCIMFFALLSSSPSSPAKRKASEVRTIRKVSPDISNKLPNVEAMHEGNSESWRAGANRSHSRPEYTHETESLTESTNPAPTSEPTLDTNILATDLGGRSNGTSSMPPVETREPELPAVAISLPAKHEFDGEPPDPILKDIVELLAAGKHELALSRIATYSRVASRMQEEIAGAIQIIIESNRESLETAKILVGQEMDLSTGKERIRGTVVDVDGNGLRVERRIVINGEVRGSTTVQIKRGDLVAKDEARIWARKFPGNEQGWFANALALLASGEMSESARALEHCQTLALAPVLRRLLDDRKTAEREALAASAWDGLRERVDKAATQGMALASERELEAYENTYGDTVFARANIDQRMEAKRLLSQMALGLDPKLSKVFHGKVVSFDPKSFMISLSYDFSDKSQLLDFLDPVNKDGSRKWSPHGVTVSHYSKYDCHLWLPQFAAEEVNLVLTIKELSRGSSGLAFRFLTSDKSRISFRVLATKVSFEIGLAASKKEVELDSPLAPGAKVSISRKGDRFMLKVEDKTVLEETLSLTIQDGLGIGGGASSSFTISSIQLNGTLSMGWVKSLTDP